MILKYIASHITLFHKWSCFATIWRTCNIYGIRKWHRGYKCLLQTPPVLHHINNKTYSAVMKPKAWSHCNISPVIYMMRVSLCGPQVTHSGSTFGELWICHMINMLQSLDTSNITLMRSKNTYLKHFFHSLVFFRSL